MTAGPTSGRRRRSWNVPTECDVPDHKGHHGEESGERRDGVQLASCDEHDRGGHHPIDQNPFTQYANRIGTPFIPARRVSDVVDMRAFRRTALWELVRGSEMPHAIQMRLPGARGTKWLIEVDRSGPNFSLRDVLVVEMLRPSLIAYEAHRALVETVVRLKAGRPDAHVDVGLSSRENQVLDLVAQGASNSEIAQSLWISPGTVRKHLEHVYLKLEVTNRTAALARTGRATPASH